MENIDKMNELSIIELKERVLKIMDYIDSFCKRNNIKYYILAGTCLGAVRHKGYIPWDDDIDIGFLREDYDKFCSTFYDDSGKFSLVDIKSTPNFYLPFAKIVDNETILKENVAGAIDIGVYVDIFPLDYVEKNKKGSCNFFKNRFRYGLEDLRYMKIKKGGSFLRNVLVVLSRLLCWSSPKAIAKKRDRRSRKSASNKKTKWIANLNGAWKEKEIVDASAFGEPRLYTFEGRQYLGPSNADLYLKTLYGDYMKLPPIEKRVTHHNFVAYKKSVL